MIDRTVVKKVLLIKDHWSILRHTSMAVPPNINQIIIYTEYPHPGSSWFEDNEKIVYMSKWAEVLNSLQSRHGPGTRVAVIADATNYYIN